MGLSITILNELSLFDIIICSHVESKLFSRLLALIYRLVDLRLLKSSLLQNDPFLVFSLLILHIDMITVLLALKVWRIYRINRFAHRKCGFGMLLLLLLILLLEIFTYNFVKKLFFIVLIGFLDSVFVLYDSWIRDQFELIFITIFFQKVLSVIT